MKQTLATCCLAAITILLVAYSGVPASAEPELFVPPLYIPPQKEYVEKTVYRSDFSRGTEGYSSNKEFINFEVIDRDQSSVLKVTRKTGAAWWENVTLDLTPYLEEDKDYFFSVDVLHDDGERAGLWTTLHNSDSNKGGKHYSATSGKWANLKAVANLESLSNPRISFSSEKETYYIRNVVVMEINQDSTTAANDPYSMAKYAKNGNFMFGTILGGRQLDDKNYLNYIANHYNILSCGNWIMLDHSATQQNAKANPDNPMPVSGFEETDRIYEFAKANKMRIRGHALFNGYEFNRWILRHDYTETGTPVSKEVAQQRLEHYIRDVITHCETNYPGITYGWDIINENFICEECDGVRNPFFEYFGKDYVKMIFSFARKHSNLKLFYNDWATFGKEARKHHIEIANWLNDGIPVRGWDGQPLIESGLKLIDGIGMECYIPIDDPNILNPKAEDYIMKVVREYNKAGLEVQMTETTIFSYDNTVQGQKEHAKFLYILLRTLLIENPKLQAEGLAGITCVSFWSVTDAFDLLENDYAYGLAGLASGFLDFCYNPKPTFYAVIAALKGERFPFD